MSTRQLLITFIPSISVFLAAVVVSKVYEINIRYMVNEGGIISDLGIILWCASASVCFFAAITLHNSRPGEKTRFLFYSAFLTAYLLFDDFFQLHEVFFPRYLGLDEKVIIAILGVTVISYLIAFKHVIFQTNYIFLLLALGFLGTAAAADGVFAPMEIIYTILGIVIVVSVCLVTFNRAMFRAYASVVLLIAGLCVIFVAIDSIVDHSEYVLEDGAKWLGIACWCSYYVHTAHKFITVG